MGRAKSRAKHRRHRDKELVQKRDYRRENAERLRAEARSYYYKDREAAIQRTRDWEARNQELVLARKRERGRWLTERLRDYISALRADPCAYCGGPAETIDHIESTLLGGAMSWENLTAACRSCNCSKSDKGFLIWLADRA